MKSYSFDKVELLLLHIIKSLLFDISQLSCLGLAVIMCKGDSNSPPCPLDDASISNPLECPPLRWGLIGCGRVSHDFTQALKLLPSAKVVACSARSIESAKTFADKHNIPTYCKSLPSPFIHIDKIFLVSWRLIYIFHVFFGFCYISLSIANKQTNKQTNYHVEKKMEVMMIY